MLGVQFCVISSDRNILSGYVNAERDFCDRDNNDLILKKIVMKIWRAFWVNYDISDILNISFTLVLY